MALDLDGYWRKSFFRVKKQKKMKKTLLGKILETCDAKGLNLGKMESRKLISINQNSHHNHHVMKRIIIIIIIIMVNTHTHILEAQN